MQKQKASWTKLYLSISGPLRFVIISASAIWTVVVLCVLSDMRKDESSFFHRYSYHCPYYNHGVSLADFVQFYKLGKIASSNQRYQAYNPEVQRQWTLRLVPGLKPDEYCFSHNPPQLFIFMGPLTRLPMLPAYWFFTIGGALTGLVALLLFWLRFQQTDMWTTTLFLSLVVGSVSSWLCLLHGQLSWLELACISLYFRYNSKKDDFLSGIALALSTVKLQYAPFLLVPALACGRYRLLLFAALAEALTLIMAGMVIGFHNVINYPAIVLSADTNPKYFWIYDWIMVCIRGPLSRFLSHVLAMEISLGFALVMLVLLLLVWLRTKQFANNSDHHRWAIALTVLGALLASPHTHYYDCLFMAVPAAATMPWCWQRAQANPIYSRIWFLLVLSYPVTSWMCYASNNFWIITVLHATLFLCCFLNWRLGFPMKERSNHAV